MGIDYDAKIIYGWHNDDIITFLKKNKASSCSRKDKDKWTVKTQCVCGPSCWQKENTLFFPDNLFFVYTCPYYDADRTERFYFLSLINDRTFTGTIEELCNIKCTQEIKDFVIQLGSSDKNPSLFAEVDIN